MGSKLTNTLFCNDATPKTPLGDQLYLTERDKEKLFLVMAADLAQRRLERGLKLNYPEAVAVISAELLERARDGRSVAELMSYGQRILTVDQVMPGVAEMIPEVQIEATFPDGTKLVTVHQPILPALTQHAMSISDGLADEIIPGEVLLSEESVEINSGSLPTEISVVNHGDRPVQVGSHYHFYEVNDALEFDRVSARGKRLNIPSGTAVRFEPNQPKRVSLIEYTGSAEQ